MRFAVFSSFSAVILVVNALSLSKRDDDSKNLKGVTNPTFKNDAGLKSSQKIDSKTKPASAPIPKGYHDLSDPRCFSAMYDMYFDVLQDVSTATGVNWDKYKERESEIWNLHGLLKNAIQGDMALCRENGKWKEGYLIMQKEEKLEQYSYLLKFLEHAKRIKDKFNTEPAKQDTEPENSHLVIGFNYILWGLEFSALKVDNLIKSPSFNLSERMVVIAKREKLLKVAEKFMRKLPEKDAKNLEYRLKEIWDKELRTFKALEAIKTSQNI